MKNVYWLIRVFLAMSLVVGTALIVGSATYALLYFVYKLFT